MIRPILVRVDFFDGLWLHEFEPMRIVAYSESRRESLEAFRLEFAACWDELALEDDTNLTADARELKDLMITLVDQVEEVA